ncbi:glycosyltransferase [Plantactinospora siamensis]|uniref:Glycosyltransferase n=1 Tax=Plantactinospora siamensis TaxID=555372 RepID=A0ABV6P4S7_9ACTN
MSGPDPLAGGGTSTERRVVIWRSCLLPASETFIRQQGAALTTWRPSYLGAVRVDSALASASDVIAFPDTPAGRRGWLELRLTGRSGRLRELLAELDPALVHAHFGGDGRLVARSAQRLGIPLVVTLHGLDVTRQAAATGARGRRHRHNLRDAFGRAALILAVSGFIRDRAVALGADPDKVRVHHTGVPVPPEPAPAAKGWDVAFVGRFVPKKGVDDLVAALSRSARRPRAVFIGDGPLFGEIRDRAARAGLDATFLGGQPPAVVARELAAARILVAPSKTAADGDTEGLPTTLLEAGALGVPAVSTYHSGIPEAVLDGETGLLCPEADPAALAAAIDRLLGDDELRTRLGRAARRRVAEHFDIRRQTRRLELLYDEVAGRET